MDYEQRQREILEELAQQRAIFADAITPGEQRDAIRRIRQLFLKGIDERLGLDEEHFLIPFAEFLHTRERIMQRLAEMEVREMEAQQRVGGLQSEIEQLQDNERLSRDAELEWLSNEAANAFNLLQRERDKFLELQLDNEENVALMSLQAVDLEKAENWRKELKRRCWYIGIGAMSLGGGIGWLVGLLVF